MSETIQCNIVDKLTMPSYSITSCLVGLFLNNLFEYLHYQYYYETVSVKKATYCNLFI